MRRPLRPEPQSLNALLMMQTMTRVIMILLKASAQEFYAPYSDSA